MKKQIKMLGAIVVLIAMLDVSASAQKERVNTITVETFSINTVEEDGDIIAEIYFEIEEEIALSVGDSSNLGVYGQDLMNMVNIMVPYTTKEHNVRFTFNQEEYDMFLKNGFDYLQVGKFDDELYYYFNEEERTTLLKYFSLKGTPFHSEIEGEKGQSLL